MSFHSNSTLVRSLTAALAAVLLNIGTAAASDSQEQARELLLGVRSTLPPTAQSAVKPQKSTGDAQESARQLLLGVTTPASGQAQGDVSKATHKHAHGDAQLLARQVLLGRL